MQGVGIVGEVLWLIVSYENVYLCLPVCCVRALGNMGEFEGEENHFETLCVSNHTACRFAFHFFKDESMLGVPPRAFCFLGVISRIFRFG